MQQMDRNGQITTIGSKIPQLYFAGVFAWSWFFWLLAATFSQQQPWSYMFVYIGGIGPLIIALDLLYGRHTRAAQRDYWLRVFDVRRIGARWFAVIFLIVPSITALAALLDMALGGSGGHWEAAAARIVAQPPVFVPFALMILLFGPVPEELGWRGYVLDHLLVRWNPLPASLVLGVAWAMWHLPLFAIPGTYQYTLGVASPRFFMFMLTIVVQSVVMTWVYNHTHRSILAAILLHFMINVTGELVALSSRADVLYLLVWVALAIAITMSWATLPVGHVDPTHDEPAVELR